MSIVFVLPLLASVVAMAKSPVRFLGPPEKKPADGGVPDAGAALGPHETPAAPGTSQSVRAQVSAGATDPPLLKAGDRAPELTGPLVVQKKRVQGDRAGSDQPSSAKDNFSLQSLLTREAPRAVLLSFFATWCKPSTKELALLQRIATEYNARGLRVVAVAIDKDQAAWPAVHALLARHHVSFPVVDDRSNHIARLYLGERHALPAVFLVKPGGRLVFVKQGYPEDAATFLELEIEKALVTQ